LVQLGVDPQAIREEIVRLHDFPETFLGEVQGGPVEASGGGAPPPPTTAPAELQEATAGGGVGPGTIQPLLPGA
jgi:hypothetical protein